MKIMVVNPNTSESMTRHMEKELERVRRSDTKLTVVCAETGPETIESAYEEAFAIPPTLNWVKRANQQGYDAVVLACFSDPGLEAAKEISKIPVVGIGEATYHMAAMLGAKFSIITIRKEYVPAVREQVHRKGLEYYLASVINLGLSVAETDAKPEEAKRRVLELSKKAIEEDGAEVVILGCAGMSGYASEIESKLGAKVLDPTAVALKTAEAMVDLGLSHSKVGLFAQPPEKHFK